MFAEKFYSGYFKKIILKMKLQIRRFEDVKSICSGADE